MSQPDSTLTLARERNVSSVAAVLAGIARALVEFPEHVRVHAVSQETNTVLTLEVKAEDIEYITGKNCRTATSLRTILSAISAQTDLAISLDIRVART